MGYRDPESFFRLVMLSIDRVGVRMDMLVQRKENYIVARFQLGQYGLDALFRACKRASVFLGLCQ